MLCSGSGEFVRSAPIAFQVMSGVPEGEADRWGEGAEVGLEQLTDPEHGLGLPDGFGSVSEPLRLMSRRDRLLLDLAGTAAVEGSRSVILTKVALPRGPGMSMPS